jgi:hypothetical protein
VPADTRRGGAPAPTEKFGDGFFLTRAPRLHDLARGSAERTSPRPRQRALFEKRRRAFKGHSIWLFRTSPRSTGAGGGVIAVTRATKKIPLRGKNGLHFFTFAPDIALASSTERRSIAETLRQIIGTSRTASDWVD